MEVSQQRRHFLIFAALTAASILIFQINVVFFLFAVPLFIIQQRYGVQYLFMAGFFVALVIVIQTVIRGSGIEGKSLRQFLIIAELAYPLAIICGVIGISYYQMRTLHLLIAATMGFAILSFPMIYYYSGNEEIVTLLKDQIIYVSDIFSKGAASSDSFESAVLLKELQPDRIIEATSKLVFRNYLVAYFIMLTGSWYFADAVSRRWHRKPKFKLVEFIVPEILIWPLIVSLIGILADVFVGIGWVGHLMWNSTFIMALIYGLHGIGLIEYLLNRYKVSRSIRRFIVIIGIAVLLLPGINLVILIGVPVLGVSELWIRYRT
jgi:uncharacterized protein (DUF486 family)